MRILFTRFPLESRFGGAEVQTVSLMKGLMERGHEVSFLGSCPTLLQELSGLTSQVSHLTIGPPPVTKWNVISFLWRQFSMKRKLIAEVSRLMSSQDQQRVNACRPKLEERRLELTRNDLTILMLSLSEKLLLTRWAHTRGIRVVWIEHDAVGNWLTKNPWLHRLNRLQKLATTVVVSDLSKEIYVKMEWDPAHIISIPNGIDTDHFSAIAAERKPPNFPHLRIGCIARLTRDKGVDVLIDAMKNLPDVSLTILGTGPELSLLKSQVPSPKSQVLFLDSISNITDFYSEIDLLILPSRTHDPFGLVVAEAMASGIPAICTDACGIAQYLEDAKMVVPAENAAELHHAIQMFQVPDVWHRHAEKGYVSAKKLFTLNGMTERYVRLLTDNGK